MGGPRATHERWGRKNPHAERGKLVRVNAPGGFPFPLPVRLMDLLAGAPSLKQLSRPGAEPALWSGRSSPIDRRRKMILGNFIFPQNHYSARVFQITLRPGERGYLFFETFNR